MSRVEGSVLMRYQTGVRWPCTRCARRWARTRSSPLLKGRPATFEGKSATFDDPGNLRLHAVG